jgi:hypothetical protein
MAIVHSIRRGFLQSVLVLVACAAAQPILYAQTLHAVIACDTDDRAGLGSDIVQDKELMEAFLARNIPANQLHLVVLDVKQMNPNGITSAIDGLNPAPTQDSVLFFFSGHGAHDEQKGFFFNLPARGEVLRSDVTRRLIAKSPKMAILLTDCCGSFDSFIASQQMGRPPQKAAQKLSPLASRLFFSRPGLVSVTSSKAGEYSMTRGDGHGSLFTYALYGVLSANEANSKDWAEIVDLTSKNVKADFQKMHPNGVPLGNGQTQDKQTVTPLFLAPTFGVGVTPDGNKLRVTIVVPLSPAAAKGFEVGDQIVEINGNTISTVQDFNKAVDDSPNTLRFKVINGKDNQPVEGQLELSK